MVGTGKAPPEIVVLNDYSLPNGGSTIVALLSARELARRGHHVTLFTAKGPPPAAETGIRSVCLDQDEICDDRNRVRAVVRGLHNITAARALRRELGSRDPKRTVVHVHTYTKALSSSVIAAALDLGFPVVLSMHDYFVSCPNGSFFLHLQSAICEHRPLSWQCVTCNCDRRHMAHKQWRVARTLLQNRVLKLNRRITHYIGVSEFSVRVLKPLLPPTARVTMIRNPVQCVDHGPAPVEQSEFFVFVGRFSPEKGPQLFAKAVAKVGIPAVFVGDGELRSALRRECPSATFTGWLAGDDVCAWIRRARALVFPPLLYETLGLVVVEAAAAGVPAIVASRSAATDFVRHEETGLIFEHGSVDSLCDRLADLWRSGSKAARLGEAAYRWYWQDPWTVERHVDELLDVYGRILAG